MVSCERQEDFKAPSWRNAGLLAVINCIADLWHGARGLTRAGTFIRARDFEFSLHNYFSTLGKVFLGGLNPGIFLI